MQAVATRTAAENRWLVPTIAAMFFLSGACGLIYQVLWLRHLNFIFGVTIYAASTVLASFMAGLALGSYLAGRLSDRVKSPLLWYAVAEILIGISALLTPAALDFIQRAYVSLHPSLPQGLAWLTLVRFLFSSVVLIVPTTLMGATLPLILKSSFFGRDALGARVSLLYASNTAGAIVGTALAGFYLIGKIGMFASFQLAAALNVFVGALAALVAWAWQRQQQRAGLPIAESLGAAPAFAEPSSAEMTSAEAEISERAAKTVLWVFALSGLVSLALEVIWFRILTLFIEVTTYAFTIMLATFLCGIAIGSYLVTPLMKRRWRWEKRLRWLAFTEIAIALLSLLSLSALSLSPTLFNWLRSSLLRPVGDDLALMLVASFLAIFPSTLLMGAAFPVGLWLWSQRATHSAAATEIAATEFDATEIDATEKGLSPIAADAGKRIGVFYSLNVVGSILGSLLAGFLLLPMLGSKGSLIIFASLSLLCGWLLLAAMPQEQRRKPVLAAAAVGVLAFLILAVSLPDPFRLALKQRYGNEKILWSEEGKQVSVSINEQPGGLRVMYLDGLHQASDGHSTLMVHRWIGSLPTLLHPNPKDVLVVGMGGGATPGAMSKQTNLEIDVVELSDTVVRGAEWFSHINYDLVKQPNVHVRVDDGRNYLMLTQKKYDIITADIIRPKHAGAGNLYSVEYFRLARQALKEDGLMVQWLSRASVEQYQLIMRTFLEVFPDATLWDKGSIIIGGKKPLALNPEEFARRLQNPVIREVLNLKDGDQGHTMESLFSAGAEEMRAYVGVGAILTDDRPLTEYFLSLGGEDGSARKVTPKGDLQRYLKE